MCILLIQSMTGFGRGEAAIANKSFTVEIKSVNNKYLDLTIKMPKIINPLEARIRDYIKKYITRGKVDVYINFRSLGMDNKKLLLDEDLAKSYADAMYRIKDICSIDDRISLSLISKFPDVVTIESNDEDEEELWLILETALKTALINISQMRTKEGQNLREDMQMRLDLIKETVEMIEEKSPIIVIEYKEKLQNRIKELADGVTLDEQRLVQEVAIMSDKINVTEEIVRLYSHIDQMTMALNEKEAVGKKLNFIVQEMNRESNTINSKANDLSIINDILLVKCEIEKIKEQIQNIE